MLNEKHITITENGSLSFTQVWNDSWEFEKSILPHESLQMDVTANDTACIMYTSGTTAKPKGVLISHENYLFAGHSSGALPTTDV